MVIHRIPKGEVSVFDLTPLLLEAESRLKTWQALAPYRWLVAVLAENPKATLDWDIGSGEKWARVVEEAPVMYACFDLPLVFLADQIKTPLAMESIEDAVVVGFQSSDEERFRVDLDAFRTAFPTHRWRTRACNPECFSVNDLHWMTAT